MFFAKKDALKRLFLCPCVRPWVAACIASLLITQSALANTNCPSPNYDETNRIKYIIDGDTLQLKDGRKVRLIGINAPETARDNRAAQPFAAEATNALKALFAQNKSISLVYGNEKFDRYKRLLAHGFTTSGENIQAVLLAQGYAHTITFPPNARFATCYQQQEREARCNKAGLWQKSKSLIAKKLNDTHIGFQLVEGKLKDININKKGIRLNLDNKLTVGIRPDNQSLFDTNTLHKMLDQKIVVRGWLNKNKNAHYYTPYYIRARHPSSIQLISDFTCH
ncbi:hypothetical protein MNBD_GAMMA06-134 [hydrothermal vent metagenome]|uniref:TNase-like domain-containing protein n=1 Tax=hydrothermal vent metagenome TaxID=652676 RepID=A0A3B0W6W5_9ZZZZ